MWVCVHVTMWVCACVNRSLQKPQILSFPCYRYVQTAWHGCWEPNLRSLQEQFVLLATKPFLQSLKLMFITYFMSGTLPGTSMAYRESIILTSVWQVKSRGSCLGRTRVKVSIKPRQPTELLFSVSLRPSLPGVFTILISWGFALINNAKIILFPSVLEEDNCYEITAESWGGWGAKSA